MPGHEITPGHGVARAITAASIKIPWGWQMPSWGAAWKIAFLITHPLSPTIQTWGET